MEWLDKMFDKFLYWLENVQWNRDTQRRLKEKKKEQAKIASIKKKVEDAKQVLIDNGYSLEKDWQDIIYQETRYTPVMIEESFDGKTIIITAKKDMHI